jgi:hypothetical protein
MIIECICADGTAFSPGFVFEGQKYDPEWFKTEDHVCISFLITMAFTNGVLLL